MRQSKHGERLRIHCRYDPLGRRIGKQIYRNDDHQPYQRTDFQWQGLRLLQEVQDGRPSLYLYAGTNNYEPLARIDGNPGSDQIYYFHTNIAGLPEQLTDEHGLSVWHGEFKAWGNSRDEWHRTQGGQEQNLRFQGQYLDRETGLHHNTFRFYDPDVGRLTQTDQIGLLVGSIFYQYAPNAVGWVDPWGLNCDSTDKFNWKSVKQFGHTFSEHGAEARNTQRLLDRARGTGKNQRQWLNNDQASQIIGSIKINEPTKIQIPPDLGQVITLNGDIITVRAAMLMPNPADLKPHTQYWNSLNGNRNIR
ncbi:RHS repeat domain-containing protein [Pseudomonas abieticivorans]|uniref:RHS repeat domain-containing protein n=1 Tax=Pseudomonas abieticivorans TaxID=2931382 RepID=UPI0020C0E347|nr:RHS repeat-associated core domain-containing protein [Pseudomonas sp. PIA16]